MRRPTAPVTAMLLCAIAGGCGDPASPGAEPAVRLEVVSGDRQEAVSHLSSDVPIGSGVMPESLRVRVVDAAGRPLAGRIVNWTTTGGVVSPTPSRTDAAGMAAAHWSILSPNDGWPAPGLLHATATVHGGGEISFVGFARVGVQIWNVVLSSDTVDVRAGAAPVTMTVRLADDRSAGSITHVRAWFRGPAATPGAHETASAELAFERRIPNGAASALGPYDMQDWSGTLTLPSDAALGDWRVDRLELRWGAGESDGGEIAGSWGAVLHVVGDGRGA